MPLQSPFGLELINKMQKRRLGMISFKNKMTDIARFLDGGADFVEDDFDVKYLNGRNFPGRKFRGFCGFHLSPRN